MASNVRKIAFGTAIAGALGYLAGILTAPKSGADMRQTIKNSTGSAPTEIEKQLKKLHTELNNLLGSAAEDVHRKAKTGSSRSDSRAASEALEGEIVNRASRAKQKTREVISALHDGNADDHDLDLAVKQASEALSALKNYLKK